MTDNSTITSNNTATSSSNKSGGNLSPAFDRLYNATTNASKQNEWLEYKRMLEERKKKLKLDPKDSEFLAYGMAIIAQSPARKQCAPSVPRVRPELQRNYKKRDSSTISDKSSTSVKKSSSFRRISSTRSITKSPIVKTKSSLQKGPARKFSIAKSPVIKKKPSIQRSTSKDAPSTPSPIVKKKKSFQRSNSTTPSPKIRKKPSIQRSVQRNPSLKPSPIVEKSSIQGSTGSQKMDLNSKVTRQEATSSRNNASFASGDHPEGPLDISSPMRSFPTPSVTSRKMEEESSSEKFQSVSTNTNDADEIGKRISDISLSENVTTTIADVKQLGASSSIDDNTPFENSMISLEALNLKKVDSEIKAVASEAKEQALNPLSRDDAIAGKKEVHIPSPKLTSSAESSRQKIHSKVALKEKNKGVDESAGNRKRGLLKKLGERRRKNVISENSIYEEELSNSKHNSNASCPEIAKESNNTSKSSDIGDVEHLSMSGDSWRKNKTLKEQREQRYTLKKRDLFKPKTWRDSFYNNPFISKVNNEKVALPD